MAFTEFYCDSASGSNLNAGSTTDAAAVFTKTGGDWDGTSVFTALLSDLSGISAGMWASVYPDADTVAVYVARITAVDNGAAKTITLSTTAKSGTAPSLGLASRTIKVGGAWKGPNGASSFPFGFVQATMMNSSSDPLRVNFKSGTNYAITAAMTHNNTGPTVFQGYTTTVGDGGRATIDGGTSGASYVLLTLSQPLLAIEDLIFSNNGATGSAAGVVVSGGRGYARRCVFASVRGHGYSNTAGLGLVVECEAYGCNQSNSANTRGFSAGTTAPVSFARCIAHDNTGSNSGGFGGGVSNQFIDCVADTNGAYGFQASGNSAVLLKNCVAYSNTTAGIATTGSGPVRIENCILATNGTYGIDNTAAAGASLVYATDCAFRSNTSGETNGHVTSTDGITLSALPFVDAPNGDFRVNVADVKGTGRGSFTQTASSYAGTVGYPDVGAAQHQETGGINRAALPSGLSALG